MDQTNRLPLDSLVTNDHAYLSLQVIHRLLRTVTKPAWTQRAGMLLVLISGLFPALSRANSSIQSRVLVVYWTRLEPTKYMIPGLHLAFRIKFLQLPPQLHR